ncbi:COX15/CtaA family protein, partial [Pallidibacillus pasinlerensis]
MLKKLKLLAVASSLGMIVLLLGGALVTKTNSGDACGTSWPLCHGQLIPSNITIETIIELSHRIVTGIVAIVVTVFAFLCWKYIGHIRETKTLSTIAVGFIIIQSLIGAANVIWSQSDFILAIHFGVSLISFAAVFLLTLLVFEIDKKFKAELLVIDKRMKIHTIGLFLYSFIVIYTGALVRHTESSMVCGSWPFCQSGILNFPQNTYEWIQMGHRFAAGILFIWILYTMIIAVKSYKDKPILYYGWVIAFSLISAQIATGAMVVFLNLNLIIALFHALFITILFGILSYFVFLISRSKVNEEKVEKLYQNKAIYPIST